MNLPIVNSKAYTSRGNKYSKTRAGKLIGAVGMGVIANKSADRIINSQRFDVQVRALATDFFENNPLATSKLFRNVDMDTLVGSLKKNTRNAAVAGAVVAGLTVGAVVDFFVNAKRQHEANKAGKRHK